MKNPPNKSVRPARWWLAGAVVIIALGISAWPVLCRARAVSAGLPPRPDVSAAAPILGEEIDHAETGSTRWGFSNQALVQLAGLYHANGFPNEALQCYRLLARLEPREARWPHLIASLESTFGRLDAALPAEREAARLAPGEFIVQYRLGDLLAKSNATAEAGQAYQRALQLSPDNPYVLLGLARIALRRDDWTGARTPLRQAVAAQDDFAPGWALLAQVETHLGHDTDAAFARRKGNAQFREINDPWLGALRELCYDPYQLSVMAATTTDHAAARLLLERALALAPNEATYHRQLAKLLVQDRDTAGARAHLEAATKLVPDDAEAWSSLVELLISARDGRAAMAALAEGLSHCPQSGFLHLTNGQRFAGLGHPAEAEAEYLLAQRLQPTEARGYIELAALYVQAGRIAEAANQARLAHHADPANITVLGMLAQLAIMEGNEADAIDWTHRIQALPTNEASTLNRIRAAFQQQFSKSLPE